MCELLYDITVNVISAGTFPIERVWSSQQIMSFTMARLHTRPIQQQQETNITHQHPQDEVGSEL